MLELIHHDGDIWAVIGHGVVRDDGLQYCHLASTTRFVQQRNGQRAVQIADWINPSDIELEFAN
jgi:hypothetical protein